MTEPSFVIAESARAFADLLPTRSIEEIQGAINIYRDVILPARDTAGIRRELAMLETELERRGQ